MNNKEIQPKKVMLNPSCSSRPWAVAKVTTDAITAPPLRRSSFSSCKMRLPSKTFVPRSAQVESVPTFCTLNLFCSIASCTHSSLSDKCFTFPTPFLDAMPFAADESVRQIIHQQPPSNLFINTFYQQSSGCASCESIVFSLTRSGGNHCLSCAAGVQQV